MAVQGAFPVRPPSNKAEWLAYLQEENQFLKEQLAQTRTIIAKAMTKAIDDDGKAHEVMDVTRQ